MSHSVHQVRSWHHTTPHDSVPALTWPKMLPRHKTPTNRNKKYKECPILCIRLSHDIPPPQMTPCLLWHDLRCYQDIKLQQTETKNTKNVPSCASRYGMTSHHPSQDSASALAWPKTLPRHKTLTNQNKKYKECPTLCIRLSHDITPPHMAPCPLWYDLRCCQD